MKKLIKQGTIGESRKMRRGDQEGKCPVPYEVLKGPRDGGIKLSSYIFRSLKLLDQTPLNKIHMTLTLINSPPIATYTLWYIGAHTRELTYTWVHR